jgi:hypothetical protein
MQAGRRKAGEAKRQEAVQRVLNFRQWLDDDREYARQLRDAATFGKRMTAKKPKVPVTGLPSDSDYDVARQEGAIT